MLREQFSGGGVLFARGLLPPQDETKLKISKAGSGGAMAGVDHKAADQIVERSLEAGVNFIDIADVYWFGESERLLGQALKNLDVPRKDVDSPFNAVPVLKHDILAFRNRYVRDACRADIDHSFKS
ncbi:hypothetical protein FHT86_000764 [Rhizobium sp. BK313]|nr:hypothetical protein [Rhizobium sp. BK313]